MFNQLVAERPSGGFWTYEELKRSGIAILGFPPFSTTHDLKTKLDGSLSRELVERAGLIVTHGHKQSGRRGVRIERYIQPTVYQQRFEVDDQGDVWP